MQIVRDIFLGALICSTLVYGSCNSSKYKEPIEDPKDILANFNSFWKYWNKEVKLSEDFVCYNEHNVIIDREFFLNQISKGEDFPLLLKSTDSVNYYKLYNIKNLENDAIVNTIKMYGDRYYKNYEMEGKPLPGFNYVDLNNRTYNQENCKGKIVVINFWFIGCTSCVAEMPKLNELVTSYKNRDDVLFISLAFDPKNKLLDFLKKTIFNYAVISVNKFYVSDTLHIMSFPTHIILNKKNLVAKVPEDYHELEIELKKEALK